MLKTLLEIFIIIIAWFLIVSFFAFYTSIHPKKIASTINPSEFGYQYEKVSFKTEDGLTLKGWFIPAKKSPAKTIIILHGYPADKGDVLTWGIFLHEKYNLLFFDFRYCGESEGKYTSVGFYEVKDLKAAVRYLATRQDVDSKNIGAMGFSLGGAVALMGAKDIPEIKAVVADSSFATLNDMAEMLFQRFFFLKKPLVFMTSIWSRIFLKVDPSKVSPEKTVNMSHTPLLLIHGDKDKQIPLRNSQKIFESANNPKELWVVKGADHGEAYFLKKEEYEQKVLNFFGSYLEM